MLVINPLSKHPNISIERDEIKLSTWLLAIYFFLAPLDFFPIIPGVSIQRVLAFLPLTGCLLYLKTMKISFDQYFVLPILYVSFLIFTSLYTVSAGSTQVRIFTTGTNIALVLLLGMLSYCTNEINFLKKSLVYSGWVAFLLLLFSIDNLQEGRFSIGIGGESEDINNAVGFFIFPFIYYLEQAVKKRNFRYIICVILFLSVGFLTGSRGGMLALTGAAMIYAFAIAREKRLTVSLMISLVALLTTISLAMYFVFNILPPELQYRFVPHGANLLSGGESRFKIWNSILENFGSFHLINQLFGMGAGTVALFTFNNKVGHNVWLDSLVEAGLIGTFILCVFYVVFLAKAFKLKDHLIFSVFSGYLLMALSLSLYRFRPIWNILLLIIILKNNNIED